ncbi:hypothetical protein BJX61DRAFT_546685 [Aspergillus egyptiacus]|nr:hypothetical protein BJX61DRAFT_546685 [Aspergillus egyptiacus]
MRLHLTIQRHGLPVTRILWTTSPPSLFGHNLPNPSSILPATSSAVTSSRAPNALYANGGYTIAQLLEDVNEVVPLETEPRLFDNQSSGQWGLEDYVVEVGGSECLHYMEVEGLLRDGDEVLIRALQISDLRARRLSGRHQISADGKHLIDGVPFGKPFLKRPTSSRPAVVIPPRKKRRTTLALWGAGSAYEEEDTEWAPHQPTGAGKKLSLLKPDSEIGKEGEYDYKYSYQDDYEDYHEPNEDGDGTVIRHNVDTAAVSEGDDDDDASGFEPGDLTQELQDLKKDMEVPVPTELEKVDAEVAPGGHYLRSRSSIQQPGPRKSSLSRRSIDKASEDNSPQRNSKSVTFDKPKQELPTPKREASPVRAGSTSEESEESVSSESDSSSSASESSDSEPNEEDMSSDESSASETSTNSSPESESNSESDDSSSESSESESESEDEDVPLSMPSQKHPANPPGTGSIRTKKLNQRVKLRRRLSKYKQLGVLGENADFAALRQLEAENGGPLRISRPTINSEEHEKEVFEAKRQKLLRDLESGGVDISLLDEKENIGPSPAEPESSQQADDHDEHYVTANDTTEATPDIPQRRTLDVASTRRLLFGSLGVKTPRTKEEEEATRKKLAGKAQKVAPQPKEQGDAEAVESHESEPEVDWREKLILGATECVYDDIELSTPPFPFEQRWDAEAASIIKQRKGWGKKRKRRQQLQVYDDAEGNEDGYYAEDDTQLNYDDAQQPEAETDNKDVSEQTAVKSAESSEEDLPVLPSDTDGLPGLTTENMKPGLVFAFKQLDLSKETNWQPVLSDYRVAVVVDVFDNNILNIRLAKPYRRQPKDTDAEEGPFHYSGFEMPGMDEDEEEDDGFREVPFDDLTDPKLLRDAPAADAGDKDTASIFPADEDLPAREPSQPAIDGLATNEDDEAAEKPSERPTSPNINRVPFPSKTVSREDSSVRSPRFEGFEHHSSVSSPVSNAQLSPASASGTHGEHQERSASEDDDRAQPSLPSTYPPNVDDHGLQETGLTDQLQTIRAFQDLSSPIKSEKKGSPAIASALGSPVVPNPFYEVDKAYEERRRRSRVKRERDRLYDSPSKRGPLPKVQVPSSPKSPTKCAPKSPSSTQDPSLVSVIPDSILPEAREQSPSASQMPEFIVDLTQSSPPVSPGGSDEDYAKAHRLPRGSGWVSKNFPTRRQTRHRTIRTEELSISPPRRRRGRKS